jgi:hypothetical protein
MPLRTGHGIRLSYYEFGATSMFACRADQRFSFCLYVPRSYEEEASATYPMLVLIHGTGRGAQAYRDQYAEFAEQHQCIVLAPLFPCGIIEPGELSNYKFLKFHDIRFDLLLLSMVAEVGERYRIRAGRFLIHGFSGGGHFVHRFLYLHPERLLAASIGAPGMVTLLDPSKPWWVGIGGMEAQFGKGADIAGMRDVRVQMVVGADDTDTWEITLADGMPHWMPGVNDAGRTRVERLHALRDSFVKAGIAVRLDVVPGVKHQGFHPAFTACVREFLSAALAEAGESAAATTGQAT